MLKIQKKSKNDYATKTFRLPVKTIERLDKLSEENNLTRNALVVQCIDYALDSLDDGIKIDVTALNEQEKKIVKLLAEHFKSRK